jgi:YebC/PmpR family DNA-binding regulatory protein
MSGHSKWANIRVRKGAQDAKRGKVYTKYARLIEIAAREGGGDSMKNAKLRGLIECAKAESVPNANIERAIQKGTGDLKGEVMREITYEGYGPSGVAFIIECLTDNTNRTLSNVKLIFGKNGGRFAESGSVLWMFERKGVIEFQVSGLQVSPLRQGATEGQASLEALELELIDYGAEDFEIHDDSLRVVTDMKRWSEVRDFLQEKGRTVESAGLQFLPKQTVPVDEESLEKVHVLRELLEEDDDVSEVHVNGVRA